MSIQEMSAEAVAAALKNNEIILIDVREPREYAAERIHGALLHPLSTFEPVALPQDRTRGVVFHCGSGKRSADALQRCAKAGVSISAHMTGGVVAWKAAGLPTISVDPATGVVVDPNAE